MVRFHRNFGYLLLQSRKYIAYEDAIDMAITEFKSRYNCVTVNSERGYVYECSEEDFIMIMLTCPEVVSSYEKVS